MGGHSVQRPLFAWFVNTLLLTEEQFICKLKKFSETVSSRAYSYQIERNVFC